MLVFLSEKEQILYDFIKDNIDRNVTIRLIEQILGENYIGALGKLLHFRND